MSEFSERLRRSREKRKLLAKLRRANDAFGTFSLYADLILGILFVLWVLWGLGLLILKDAITLAVVLVLLEMGLYFLDRHRDKKLETYLTLNTQMLARLDKSLELQTKLTEALLEYLKKEKD